MREQLRSHGVSDAVVDDAVLILSELLSNACRHGRPLGRQTELGDGDVRAAWRVDRTGGLTVEVTDGGGPTRPVPATPSVTARGGRGLNIISALAREWGVRDDVSGEVTVWVLVDGAYEASGRSGERPGGRGSGRSAGTTGLPNAHKRKATVAPGLDTAGLDTAGLGMPGLEGLDLTGVFDDAFDDVG
ncbi:ATP-binding protein [Streptomyces sp. OfavH-34-F]|uniref:ATP-binding protein n=1 Tax=Streptomyces sp. OfavH-34-F TaxID=2917760 RepID=UPI001EF39FD3|nr:ATP-binding protein [Streptomyces sp. OfavH-34-F]MCG7529175.1 ATP-binding protein [Streptomyces sp. OfavH-34-F]